MMIADISLFDTMDRKLDYLGARHALTAQNIANAHTPGYRAQDLKAFDSAMSRAASTGMTLTHAAHNQATPHIGDFRAERSEDGWERVPTGNSVTMAQEMIKAADIQGAHALVSNLYRKHVGMIRMAMTGHV